MKTCLKQNLILHFCLGSQVINMPRKKTVGKIDIGDSKDDAFSDKYEWWLMDDGTIRSRPKRKYETFIFR